MSLYYNESQDKGKQKQTSLVYIKLIEIIKNKKK